MSSALTETLVNAETEHLNAKIAIGTIESTGIMSDEPVALTIGDNAIAIVVTPEDDTQPTKTYTVNVKRLSDDATLQSITLSDSYTLTETFDPQTSSYQTDIPNDASTITVTATTTHAEANISFQCPGAATSANVKLTGNKACTGLDIRDNIIIMRVTAEDGFTQKAYTLNVYRKPSPDTSLSALSVQNAMSDVNIPLAPVFASTTKDLHGRG